MVQWDIEKGRYNRAYRSAASEVLIDPLNP
jgi:hypothetical protein